MDFKYDQFSNVVQQSKTYYPLVNGAPGTAMATASETYQYDELQRMTQESRSYANFTPGSSTRLGESYTYADNGNILSKTDFGSTYSYGDATRPHGAGPHAVLTVDSAWSYSYDANGNMLSDGHRNVTYDDQDRPETITMDGIVTTTFRYTPDGDRYLQRTKSTADASVARTIFYVDKDYERVEWDHKRRRRRRRTAASPSWSSAARAQRPNARSGTSTQIAWAPSTW